MNLAQAQFMLRNPNDKVRTIVASQASLVHQVDAVNKITKAVFAAGFEPQSMNQVLVQLQQLEAAIHAAIRTGNQVSESLDRIIG